MEVKISNLKKKNEAIYNIYMMRPLRLPFDFSDDRFDPVVGWVCAPGLANVLHRDAVEHNRGHHSVRNGRK